MVDRGEPEQPHGQPRPPEWMILLPVLVLWMLANLAAMVGTSFVYIVAGLAIGEPAGGTSGLVVAALTYGAGLLAGLGQWALVRGYTGQLSGHWVWLTALAWLLANWIVSQVTPLGLTAAALGGLGLSLGGIQWHMMAGRLDWPRKGGWLWLLASGIGLATFYGYPLLTGLALVWLLAHLPIESDNL